MIGKYAIVGAILVTKKTLLLQANVSLTTGRKFDALARATGRTRAGYLRHLVELHVKALQGPRLARALHRTLPTSIDKMGDIEV